MLDTLLGCRKCRLCGSRERIVPGEGNLTADIMLIGESPGGEEDAKGRPFIGRSGRMLDSFLNAAFLEREDVYVTNIVKCRPDTNRDPLPDEIEACRPFLEEEIETVSPRIIGAVGRYASYHFLGSDFGILDIHGIPFRVGDRIVVPIVHPAAGLRDPSKLMLTKMDIQALADTAEGKLTPRDSFFIKDAYRYSKIENCEELIADIASGADCVAVDTETFEGKLWCMSYSIKPGSAKVVSADRTEELSIISQWLGSGIQVVMHNALFDVPVLNSAGIYPLNVTDTMVMAYLLQTEPQGLKPLALRLCGMEMEDYKDVVGTSGDSKAVDYLLKASTLTWDDPIPVLVKKPDGSFRVKNPQNIAKKMRRIIADYRKGKASPYERWNKIKEEDGRGQVEKVMGKMQEAGLPDVDIDKAVHYSARDADATLQIYPILLSRIRDLDMEPVLSTDIGIIPMVSDMMKFGIRIDKGAFAHLASLFKRKMAEAEKAVREIAGTAVNPGSPKQVWELLYKKLKLSHKLPDNAEYSTDRKTLSMLAKFSPAVEHIIAYREYSKLLGTYAEAVPVLAVEDPPGEWRIHTNFRTTRTATGRLSCSRPNLMAQPVRSKDGRKIRDCYTASEKCLLFSADYSQIEMRVVAHSSNDTEMLRIINEGLDIHSQTASSVFRVPVEDVDPVLHRYPAKAVGFGILYGMGPEGLYQQLTQDGASGWDIRKCQDLIGRWFEIYSGISSYMQLNRYLAKNTGKVKDMWGRVRFVPGAFSPDKAVQERSLRQACNDPIQGGAQGVIKKAMGMLTPLYKDYLGRGKIFRPLIQIHDDLVFEIEEDIVDEAAPKIIKIMCSAAPFMQTALTVDAKTGKRWGSLEKYKI